MDTTDHIVLSKPRPLGIGIYLYILIVSIYIIFKINDSIFWIYMAPPHIVNLIVMMLITLFSYIIIGRPVIEKMDYIDGRRRIEAEIERVLGKLIRGGVDIPKYGRKSTTIGFIGGLFIPSALYVLKFFYGNLAPAYMAYYVFKGDARGYTALVIDYLVNILIALLWLVSITAIIYILWLHKYVLDTVADSIKRELQGEDILILDETLQGIVNSSRPALEFLRFRMELAGVTSTLYTLFKRILIVLFILIAWFMGEYTIIGGDVLLVILITVFTSLLSTAIMLSTYGIYKWSSELSKLIIVELKNLRLGYYRDGGLAVARSTEEIEEMMKEMKHTIIVRREVWEVVAGLITLIAAITALLTHSPA